MAGIPPPWSRAPSRPVQEESSRQLAACRGRLQRIRFDEFIKRLAEGDQLCYMTTQANAVPEAIGSSDPSQLAGPPIMRTILPPNTATLTASGTHTHNARSRARVRARD